MARAKMKTYTLKAIGKEIDSGLVEKVNAFWQPHAKVEVGETLSPQHFASRQSLYDWAYKVYLQHWEQGTLPNMVIVIPIEYLGLSWRIAWDGVAWGSYQLALVKGQSTLSNNSFITAHEVGHLLGLSDHFGLSWRCVMYWTPWWLTPLGCRNVCSRCRSDEQNRVPTNERGLTVNHCQLKQTACPCPTRSGT